MEEQEISDTLILLQGSNSGPAFTTKASFKRVKRQYLPSDRIHPYDWTVTQLREIADYMEQNPNCSLFSDGSGSTVKL